MYDDIKDRIHNQNNQNQNDYMFKSYSHQRDDFFITGLGPDTPPDEYQNRLDHPEQYPHWNSPLTEYMNKTMHTALNDITVRKKMSLNEPFNDYLHRDEEFFDYHYYNGLHNPDLITSAMRYGTDDRLSARHLQTTLMETHVEQSNNQNYQHLYEKYLKAIKYGINFKKGIDSGALTIVDGLPIPTDQLRQFDDNLKHNNIDKSYILSHRQRQSIDILCAPNQDELVCEYMHELYHQNMAIPVNQYRADYPRPNKDCTYHMTDRNRLHDHEINPIKNNPNDEDTLFMSFVANADQFPIDSTNDKTFTAMAIINQRINQASLHVMHEGLEISNSQTLLKLQDIARANHQDASWLTESSFTDPQQPIHLLELYQRVEDDPERKIPQTWHNSKEYHYVHDSFLKSPKHHRVRHINYDDHTYNQLNNCWLNVFRLNPSFIDKAHSTYYEVNQANTNIQTQLMILEQQELHQQEISRAQAEAEEQHRERERLARQREAQRIRKMKQEFQNQTDYYQKTTNYYKKQSQDYEKKYHDAVRNSQRNEFYRKREEEQRAKEKKRRDAYFAKKRKEEYDSHYHNVFF